MREPVVILRTVSVEKMSPVLDACRERWPEAPLWVVSNAARAGEMASDGRVSRVLVHGEGGFARKLNLDAAALAVVVPVANEAGSGYGNVMAAALGVRAEGYWMCGRCRRLVELGKVGFRWRSLSERVARALAGLLSGYWAERLLERDQ